MATTLKRDPYLVMMRKLFLPMNCGMETLPYTEGMDQLFESYRKWLVDEGYMKKKKHVTLNYVWNEFTNARKSGQLKRPGERAKRDCFISPLDIDQSNALMRVCYRMCSDPRQFETTLFTPDWDKLVDDFIAKHGPKCKGRGCEGQNITKHIVWRASNQMAKGGWVLPSYLLKRETRET